MPYSHRSRRSHEESQQTKRTGDRVWMEQLEGRVLLNGAADAQALDLSVVNHLVGTTPALYRIDVPAGQKYLILDLEGQDQVHLLDAQQREIKVLGADDDDDNSRAVLAPQTSTTYYLSLQEGWGDNAFDIIVRQAHDDFGDRPATAPLLAEGQIISGEIEDFPDKDLFRFNAVAGERYVFDGVTNDLSLRILNTRGRQAIDCTDGCEPMPYTGTYYIEISGDDWWTAPYALQVRHAVDDNPGDMAGARPLSIGTPISGTIDYAYDSDWFVFNAVAGTTYEFANDGDYFTIYSADQEEMDLVEDWDYGDENYLDRQEWIAPSSGLFYIEVTDDSEPQYTITSTVQEVKDPTKGDVASAINSDSKVEGSIDAPASSQYFSFDVQKNGTYTIHREGYVGVLIALLARDGKTILNADFYGKWTAPEAGTYYLWARAFDPAGTVSFSFSMSQELDDYGNSASEAAPIALGDPVQGIIQYSWDEDWFAVDVTEGENYIFNLAAKGIVEQQSPTRRKRHSTPWTNLSIVGSDGQPLGRWSEYAYDQMKIEWTAPLGGTIYLGIDNTNTMDAFTLTVAKLADDPKPATPIAVGENSSGAVNPSSVLFYRIELEAGKTYLQPQYSQNLSYVAQPADRLGDGLSWKTIDGNEIWTVNRTGAYYIELYNWNQDPIEYSMQVSEFQPPPPPPPPVPPPAQEPAPRPLVKQKQPDLPFELADENDLLAFSFVAEAGKTYVFKTTLGTLEDSTLTLYDADGHYFDDNDDVSDDDYSSMLEWTAQNSGTYYIVVGGFGQGSFGLSSHEGKGPKANQLKLQQLSSAEARLKFAEDDSSEVQDENQSDYDLLTDKYEELDFGYVADWGFDL